MFTFKKLFIVLIASSYVRGQLSPMVAKCDTPGGQVINAFDCCRAIAQLSPDGKGQIVESTSTCTRNNFSCQIIMDVTKSRNVIVPISSATQAVEAILKQCNNGPGSVMIPRLSTRPNDPDVRITLKNGSGKYA
ncbi:hypothetical protein CROQUDRAFT_94700 [Cronartium quercuum f. sp. fusiforme G11]|uniref:Uncharacterized protein n=1 Tax=Cronartium quercuum f. sp. fusiforme G11 TaxID=708437 RepID=A0A9P6TAM3_9BASI|nr:hypothetical protein CROQUDRAFT_94700 [Cronartium quercuum f. sp. fusiforme G11]